MLFRRLLVRLISHYAWSPPLEVWISEGYLPFVNLSASTIEQREATISRFSQFLGRPATIDDLAREVVSRFIDWYGRLAEPSTVAGKRSQLLTLWRFCLQEGLTHESLDRVKVVPVPEKVPEGDDEAELRLLLASLRQLPGRVGHCTKGVPRAVIFPALAHVLLSTGLRIGAVLQVKRRELRSDRTFTVRWRSQKTWCEQTKRLTVAAMAAVEEVQAFGPFEYLLPFSRSPASVKRLRNFWRQARIAAGLPAERTNLLHQMRRTAASFKEKQQPGSAVDFLGHKTEGLARRSYLVPRIVRPDVIDGPELQL
jgi:integrase